MLTEKQEKFIRQLLEGKSQAAAYREAYDAAGMSDDSVYKEASKLARRAEIRKRLDALRKELEAAAIATARERLELLTHIIRGERSVGDKLKAVDLMNKMTGAYNQKSEPDTDVTVVVELRD